MAFASGWASGINAYATVLILGLIGRFAHEPSVPAGFERTDVLIVMGVLAALDLTADKIPYLDSVWDTLSTVIRPVAGALIGALLGGTQGGMPTITLAAVGGATALASHLTKTGIRMAINTSPEPASNILASLGNDVSVASITSLAVLHPAIAAVCAGTMLVLGVLMVALVFSRVVRGFQAVRRFLSPAARRA